MVGLTGRPAARRPETRRTVRAVRAQRRSVAGSAGIRPAPDPRAARRLGAPGLSDGCGARADHEPDAGRCCDPCRDGVVAAPANPAGDRPGGRRAGSGRADARRPRSCGGQPPWAGAAADQRPRDPAGSRIPHAQRYRQGDGRLLLLARAPMLHQRLRLRRLGERAPGARMGAHTDAHRARQPRERDGDPPDRDRLLRAAVLAGARSGAARTALAEAGRGSDHGAGTRAADRGRVAHRDATPHRDPRCGFAGGAPAIRGQPLSALGQRRTDATGRERARPSARPVSERPIAGPARTRGARHPRGRLRHRAAADRHCAALPRRARSRDRSQPRKPRLRQAQVRRDGRHDRVRPGGYPGTEPRPPLRHRGGRAAYCIISPIRCAAGPRSKSW